MTERLILNAPKIFCRGQQVIVTAQVTCPEGFAPAPRTLWFEFPASYREFLGEPGDGMVVALLVCAMGHGLDLEVRGPMSARLYENLKEFQNVAVRLFPKEVEPIEILAHNLYSQPAPAPRAVGSAFSGGVDSFFTLWSHLAQNDPDPYSRVTHGLFVQGLDISLREGTSFELCAESYRKLFSTLGLELVIARTNAREWYAGLDWSWMYISPLAGTALMLGRLLGRFYVPTGSTLDEIAPWGEFTRINRFFATETLELIDDGLTMKKADKIATLAHWDATYDHLRVCFTKINGLENCCRCTKCLNAMIALELAGTLRYYKTFPRPLTGERIRSMRIPYHARPIYYSVLKQAQEYGRKDIERDLLIAFAFSHLKWALRAGRDGFRQAMNRGK